MHVESKSGSETKRRVHWAPDALLEEFQYVPNRVQVNLRNSNVSETFGAENFMHMTLNEGVEKLFIASLRKIAENFGETIENEIKVYPAPFLVACAAEALNNSGLEQRYWKFILKSIHEKNRISALNEDRTIMDELDYRDKNHYSLADYAEQLPPHIRGRIKEILFSLTSMSVNSALCARHAFINRDWDFIIKQLHAYEISFEMLNLIIQENCDGDLREQSYSRVRELFYLLMVEKVEDCEWREVVMLCDQNPEIAKSLQNNENFLKKIVENFLSDDPERLDWRAILNFLFKDLIKGKDLLHYGDLSSNVFNIVQKKLIEEATNSKDALLELQHKGLNISGIVLYLVRREKFTFVNELLNQNLIPIHCYEDVKQTLPEKIGVWLKSLVETCAWLNIKNLVDIGVFTHAQVAGLKLFCNQKLLQRYARKRCERNAWCEIFFIKKLGLLNIYYTDEDFPVSLFQLARRALSEDDFNRLLSQESFAIPIEEPKPVTALTFTPAYQTYDESYESLKIQKLEISSKQNKCSLF